MKEKINRLIFIVVLYMVYLAVSAQAKPMPAPKLEEAVEKSTIVVAKYQSCDQSKPIDYFSGVETRFKLVRYITRNKKLKKMPRVGDTIKVNFQFDDGSACVAPRPWAFDEKKMLPAKNSQSILFLSDQVNGVFQTYRGSYGIKKYSSEIEKGILESLVR